MTKKQGIKNIQKKINLLFFAIIFGLFSVNCQNTTFADLAEAISADSVDDSTDGNNDGTTSFTETPSRPNLATFDDSGASATDNITNQKTALTFDGDSVEGATVELYVDGVASGMTGTVSGGKYTIDIDINTEGTFSITSVATLAGSQPSSPSSALSVTIDSLIAQPSVPALASADDLGVSNSDGITSQTNSLTFSGTAETGSSIQLYKDTIATGTAATATGGVFSADINLTTDGTYSITAVATDVAGNVSIVSSGFLVTIITTPPASFVAGSDNALVPALDSVSDTGISNTDGITNIDSGLVFDGNLGSGNAGNTVEVYIDGVLIGTAVADGTGDYSVGPTGTITSGDISFLIITPSGVELGPIAAGSIVVDTTAPSYTDGSNGAFNPALTAGTDRGIDNTDGITNIDTGLVFDGSVGTSNPNAYIDVYVGGILVGSAQADASGNYSVGPTGSVSSGAVTFVISDAAGNTTSTINAGSIVVDTTAPILDSITSSTADGTYGTAANINITTNFSEPVTLSGGNLLLTLNNGASDVIINSIDDSANATGTYTVADGVAESINPLNVSAVALSGGTLTDAAGNAVILSPPMSNNLSDNADIVIGNTPQIVSITSSTADGSYKAGQTVDVTVTFSSNVTLSSGFLDLTLDSSAVVSISPFINMNVVSGTYTIGASENSSDLTVNTAALSGGTLQDHITAANVSLSLPPGNNLADIAAIIVDTTLPVFSAVTPINNADVNHTNVGYTLSENIVSGTITWTRTGGAADGSIHAQTLTGTELNSGAHSNITLANDPVLVDGAIYTITFDGTDAAGNVAATFSRTNVTYDTTLPVISSVGPANGTSVNHAKVSYTLSENIASGTITWTGTAGSDIGNVHTQSLSGADLASGSRNNWNIANPPTLINGSTYTISFDGLDAAGNTATTQTVTGIVYDTTAPNNQNTVFASSVTQMGGSSVTVVSSGDANNSIWFAPGGLTTADIALFVADSTHTTAGGTAVSIAAPANEGTYYIYVIDAAGNVSQQSTAALTVDNTAPVATIADEPTGTNSATVLDITIGGTDVVTYQYAVGNGITCSGATYSGDIPVATHITDDISGEADGTITLCVRGKDSAGNLQAAASAASASWTKSIALTVTVNRSQAGDPAGAQADPTNNATVNFTVIFSGAINPATFASSDITKNGTANLGAWIITDSGDATTFTITTTATSQGTIIPSLAAGVVQNPALASNEASTSAFDNSVIYELVKPNAAINQSGGQGDPTNSSPVNFTLVFTEAIDFATFALGDFTLGGTATYSLGNLFTSDNITWTVEAIPTSDGTIVPSLAAGVVADPAGNTNNASTTSDSTVTFDSAPPVSPLTLTGAPSGTNAIPTLDVTVSGSDALTSLTHYQYKLGTQAATDCTVASGYSDDTAISTHITNDLTGYTGITNLRLCVRGKDTPGNYQTYANATSADWTRDDSTPVANLSNLPSGTNNTVILNITVSGSLVTNYKYKVGEAASTDCASASGYSASTPIASAISDNISGLADGLIKICVLGWNGSVWQSEGSATIATWTKQTTPPSLVTNGAESLDIDGNGKIDHIKLTFTQTVDATTFPGYNSGSPVTTTDWSVGAYSNVKIDLTQGDALDDEFIYLTFDEKAGTCDATSQVGCDTGVIPDVTMTVQGLKDFIGSGNLIALIDPVTVAEKDSANPVVVGADPPSNITLNVYFSETVTAATAECGSGSSQSGTDCTSIYSVDNGLTISKAIMSGGVGVNSKTVVLTSSTQTESQAYNVTVASGVVKDVSNLTTYMGANIASFSGASPVTNLVSATAIDNTTVELVFNVTVTAASAETSSYYNIPGITVSGANMYPTPGTSSPTVRLTTSSHLSSTTNGYTITVTSGSVAAATGGLTCDSPNNTTTFTGDTLPTVLTTSSLDEFTVDVTFSENVLMDTSANGALNAVNYSANGGLVLSSPQQLSNTKVRLTSGSQTLDQLYTLTVSNVWDISTPAGNTVPVTGNSRTFLGQENVKITGAARELDVQSGFDVFSVTFSKPMKFDGTTNAADKLTNWTFPSGLGTVTVCTASDDAVCPVSYTTGVDTVIYFKTSSEPALGAYTVVAASGTAANCLLPDGGTWSSSCLKSNPNDRASVDFGLPLVIGDGPVYTDPFNDSVTLSGQVVLYNGKLLIGPNDTDSGLFQTEINLSNATTIELDANNANNNPSQTNDGFNSSIVESCLFAGDTYPACANNNMLSGIDYLYTGCYSSDGSANTSLSGPACTNDGGTEYLFVLGFDTNHNANGTDTSTNKGYQSNWNTTNKTSPFIFNHIANLSSSFGRTFRAMSMVIFKGWIYQASQHQQGSYAPRWSRFLPDGTSVFNSNATGYDKSDMGGRFITRLGGAGFIKNGQHDAGMTSNWLVSIDSMYEHDDDGASGNESQLYFANGGSTDSAALTNQTRASGYMVLSGTVSATAGSRNLNGVGTSFSSQVGVGDVVCAAGQCRVIASVNSNTQIRTATGDEWSANIASGTSADSTRYYPADGGVVRSTVAYSTQANPPVNCTNATNCNTMWEDVTPTSTTWNRFMSIALPQDARAGADWDFLIPANTITPAIKAIPKMVTFNGDLYMIRNSCESVTVQTLSGSVHKTCPAYNERPQLWRLPANSGNAAAAQAAWQFVGNGTTFMTRMSGADWSDGAAQNQAAKTAENTEVTLLVVNGSRLYIGFDNSVYGANIWRTKSGITNPTSEADFEAVCDTGNACYDSTMQFGLGGATNNSRIFDGLSVNDAGTDYLILNAGDGINPMKIFRTTNN